MFFYVKWRDVRRSRTQMNNILFQTAVEMITCFEIPTYLWFNTIHTLISEEKVTNVEIQSPAENSTYSYSYKAFRTRAILCNARSVFHGGIRSRFASARLCFISMYCSWFTPAPARADATLPPPSFLHRIDVIHLSFHISYHHI